MSEPKVPPKIPTLLKHLFNFNIFLFLKRELSREKASGEAELGMVPVKFILTLHRLMRLRAAAVRPCCCQRGDDWLP